MSSLSQIKEIQKTMEIEQEVEDIKNETMSEGTRVKALCYNTSIIYAGIAGC